MASSSASFEEDNTSDGLVQRLESQPSPASLREMVQRIEELRVHHPNLAFELACVALPALGRLPRSVQRPRLSASVWAAYGSACRAVARFEEAELALMMATRVLSSANQRSRADIARRLAIVRANQRRETEARALMGLVLEQSRKLGGLTHGKRLVSAANISLHFSDFRSAEGLLRNALTLLPKNGDRFQLAAIFNLARCRLELSSTETELLDAASLVHQASQMAEPGSFIELRLFWMSGKLLQRLGRFEDALVALECARAGFDQRGDGLDRALLFLDLAELHLERGAPESAQHLALSSFGVLQALHNQPDAFRAVQLLHRAATELSLDKALVDQVRGQLLAAQA